MYTELIDTYLNHHLSVKTYVFSNVLQQTSYNFPTFLHPIIALY